MGHDRPMDVMTTGRAARLLDVSTETIRRWARDGKLKPLSEVDGMNRAMLFDRADVERLAAERSAA